MFEVSGLLLRLLGLGVEVLHPRVPGSLLSNKHSVFLDLRWDGANLLHGVKLQYVRGRLDTPAASSWTLADVRSGPHTETLNAGTFQPRLGSVT